MPKRMELRVLSEAEEQAVRRLAKARQVAASVVERARLIVYVLEHPEVPVSCAGLRVGFKSSASGSRWVKRFNEQGLAGLQDAARSGKPVTHTTVVRSQVIGLALQKPEQMGYPFVLWTIRRLQLAVQERLGIHVAGSTLWEWLTAEGLAWQRQQSWFQEPAPSGHPHDPEFVAKRGPSSRPT
jgi:transposase